MSWPQWERLLGGESGGHGEEDLFLLRFVWRSVRDFCVVCLVGEVCEDLLVVDWLCVC